MKKIRIGNDIVIKWRITINGEEVNLEGLDLSLYISTTYQPRRAIAFTVAGNEITATYKGNDQRVSGVYRLTLYRNEGENSQNILDACDAFELVSCSCLTTDVAFGGAEVELPVADLGIGVPGLSAYEIAVAEGFKGTQAEWLASLSAASEAAAAECREFTEAAKIDERDRQNNEALRVTAENERAAAETARQSAENKRTTAESGRANAESQRVTNETARKDAEASRVSAETARQSAEATRQSNEQSRQTAEQGRVTVEQQRADAEANRKVSETARKNAEDTRATNETMRVDNESQRMNAEANRVTAEAARAEEFATFEGQIAAKEDAANKVTSIGVDADDQHYPSAKAVWSAIEEKFWYGVEWDLAISAPTCTRIGNMELHRTLPVQSQMRGCLLADDGTVNKYLNPDDWTGQVRDGSRGQVMVEIPMHYRKFETNGTKRVVRLSEHPLPGYHQVPQMYVSAYEASIERSTGKLCSVVNEATDYRGGNNNANYDGTYRSFLGRPVTSISRTAFRTAARKRKSGSSEWNCYLYQVHKALFWLFAVEYATLNSQAAYNSELTSEGFRQGGLGAGVSDWSGSDWSNFNGYYPFVPCGHTDTLGNSTGVVAYTAYNADGSELKTSNVPRYRGVENPFCHIWKWTDGINVRISPTEANGGDNLSKVFVCEDPSKLNDSNYNGYKHVGNEARTEGYVKEIIFGEEGEIMPSLVGGGSTQFFCDYHWTNIPTTETLRGVLFGGHANSGAAGGLAFADSRYAPSYSNTHIGSRLCFIPATA